MIEQNGFALRLAFLMLATSPVMMMMIASRSAFCPRVANDCRKRARWACPLASAS
jgi:hypothetical protein